MGASPLMAFWTITLPLGLRGLITGAIQTWARAVSEFGAVVMVSYYPKTAPVMVYELFNNFGLKKSIPVAVITMTMSAVIFITIRLWGGKDA
jgi:molybdate/tungstate transport system permease protein